MRRTIFLALLAALLIVPSAAHAGDWEKILRDCNDDSILQGTYSVSDLREARSNIPTDTDEYGDCRDVLTRAISAGASKTPTPTPTPTPSAGGGTGSGGDSSGGASGGTAGGGTGAGRPSASPTSTPDGATSQQQQDAAVLAAPSSPQDKQAVDAALADGERQIRRELIARSPDQDRLAASVGRNGLPTTMIAVLVLIVAAVAATLLPLLRRRRDLPGHPST
jgi:hypothetical protein